MFTGLLMHQLQKRNRKCGGLSRSCLCAGKKIAFLQTLATHPYVVATTKAFRGRAEALGMEVTFFTSMLDAALQAQQIAAKSR